MPSTYSLFRRLDEPEIYCAVPQTLPLPRFVRGDAWEFDSVVNDGEFWERGFRGRGLVWRAQRFLCFPRPTAPTRQERRPCQRLRRDARRTLIPALLGPRSSLDCARANSIACGRITIRSPPRKRGSGYSCNRAEATKAVLSHSKLNRAWIPTFAGISGIES
jgi:hypothetical protein